MTRTRHDFAYSIRGHHREELSMNKIRIALILAAAVLGCGLSGIAAAAPDYDHTFLGDYSKLVATPLKNNMGTDLLYVQPGALEKLGKYTALMVDQPEILISPNSDYKGAKPSDLEAIAELVRKDVDDAMKAGGYGVVDAPGPNVLYLKMAVTDLSLKRKKRGILGYTPIGFVVKAGADALRDMMEKYDILGAAVQGEVADSASKQVLAEFVALRGNNDKRMTFDQLSDEVKGFASRLRCRLDNTHVPTDQKIDCLDPAARAAREAKGPVVH
jgi:hypothetical protein